MYTTLISLQKVNQLYLESILQAYVKDGLQDGGNHFRIESGMLAKESVDELNRKIHRLLDE